MKKINKSYLCTQNTYIFINYTTSTNISIQKERELDKIFTTNYHNFSLIDIVAHIRIALQDPNERTLRVVVTDKNDNTSLIYLSNKKIIKYHHTIIDKNTITKVAYTPSTGIKIKEKTKRRENHK